ncbi:MAG: HAD family phosphatase [Candidatus Omnitrophica bacterium]|nr:HAD family phosphatase [Candidatus Omnitrophota bacterium]
MLKEYSVNSILFDMDGVITNTMPDHFKAWKITLRAIGVNVTHLDIYAREGQRGMNSIRELLQSKKIQFTDRQLLDILSAKEAIFKKIVSVRYIPGARTLLKSCHKKGLQLGLVTGTSYPETKKILPDKYFDLFSCVITGDIVKLGKPNPEPYLLALKMLQVSAKDTIVIENAPLGIRSAKQAGIRCFALETSLPMKYLKEADMIFKSFKEFNQNVHLKKLP